MRLFYVPDTRRKIGTLSPSARDCSPASPAHKRCAFLCSFPTGANPQPVRACTVFYVNRKLCKGVRICAVIFGKKKPPISAVLVDCYCLSGNDIILFISAAISGIFSISSYFLYTTAAQPMNSSGVTDPSEKSTSSLSTNAFNRTVLSSGGAPTYKCTIIKPLPVTDTKYSDGNNHPENPCAFR